MKNKLFLVIMLGMLVSLLSMPVYATNTAQIKEKHNGQITGTQVNLREKPSTNSKVIYRFSGWQNVKVLDKVSRKSDKFPWYKVTYKGKTGWVYGKFLKIILEENTNTASSPTKEIEAIAAYINKEYGDYNNVQKKFGEAITHDDSEKHEKFFGKDCLVKTITYNYEGCSFEYMSITKATDTEKTPLKLSTVSVTSNPNISFKGIHIGSSKKDVLRIAGKANDFTIILNDNIEMCDSGATTVLFTFENNKVREMCYSFWVGEFPEVDSPVDIY